MIALYKDPQGEKVFDRYEVPSLRSQLQPTHQKQQTDSATGTTDLLKKTSLELNNTIAENKQHAEVCNFHVKYDYRIYCVSLLFADISSSIN